MEQHHARLGDVLDDYCTRERRVTNHAVVAIVGDEIKLTRCTTCDTEHPYKSARVPPRRQTKLVAALSNTPADGAEPALQHPTKIEADGPTVSFAAEVSSPEAESAPPPRTDSVRRPLIRATLEWPEGTPPQVRQAPVFTVRENAGREGNVDRSGRHSRKRRNGGRPDPEPNGNRIDGFQGQSTRSGSGKNGSRSARSGGSANRPDRTNKGQSRNRGKGRSR